MRGRVHAAFYVYNEWQRTSLPTVGVLVWKEKIDKSIFVIASFLHQLRRSFSTEPRLSKISCLDCNLNSVIKRTVGQ